MNKHTCGITIALEREKNLYSKLNGMANLGLLINKKLFVSYRQIMAFKTIVGNHNYLLCLFLWPLFWNKQYMNNDKFGF